MMQTEARSRHPLQRDSWTEPLRGRRCFSLVAWPFRPRNALWTVQGVWCIFGSAPGFGPIANSRNLLLLKGIKSKRPGGPRARPTCDSIEAPRDHVMLAFIHLGRAP